MKKRGFTLIEIIISISLIAIIGTISIVSIISLRKAKVENLLESNSKVLNNALEVYLEKHPEVTNNVNNNFKGAVVTLQVLKDEGLIDIKGLGNYKKNYYFLSNSVLADKDKVDESKCDNNLLAVNYIASWKVETDKVIYICPQNSGTSAEGIKQTLISSGSYIAKGENPNNWVKFDVKSNDKDWAYWPNDNEKDLWRIISISEDGYITLIYNKAVVTDNSRRGNVLCYGYNLASITFDSNAIWTTSELLSDHSNIFENTSTYNACYTAKKEPLLNNIIENSWIFEDKYYIFYRDTCFWNGSGDNYNDSCPKLNNFINLKLGVLTDEMYKQSLLSGKTYLDYTNILSVADDNQGRCFDIETYTKTDCLISSDYSGNIKAIQAAVKQTYDKKHNLTNNVIVNGIEYQPVVTLKNDVTIQNGTGIKNDPYILKCDSCN